MPQPSILSSRARQTCWTPAISGWCPPWFQDVMCLDVLDPADPERSDICSLRRLIASALARLTNPAAPRDRPAARVGRRWGRDMSRMSRVSVVVLRIRFPAG